MLGNLHPFHRRPRQIRAIESKQTQLSFTSRTRKATRTLENVDLFSHYSKYTSVACFCWGFFNINVLSVLAPMYTHAHHVMRFFHQPKLNLTIRNESSMFMSLSSSSSWPCWLWESVCSGETFIESTLDDFKYLHKFKLSAKATLSIKLCNAYNAVCVRDTHRRRRWQAFDRFAHFSRYAVAHFENLLNN